MQQLELPINAIDCIRQGRLSIPEASSVQSAILSSELPTLGRLITQLKEGC